MLLVCDKNAVFMNCAISQNLNAILLREKNHSKKINLEFSSYLFLIRTFCFHFSAPNFLLSIFLSKCYQLKTCFYATLSLSLSLSFYSASQFSHFFLSKFTPKSWYKLFKDFLDGNFEHWKAGELKKNEPWNGIEYTVWYA